MLDCCEYQELIDRDQDETLPFSEMASLKLHLRVCPECREYKAEASLLFVDLDRALALSPGLDLAPLVTKRIEQESWQRVLVIAGLIPAIVILLIINSATMLTGFLDNHQALSLFRIFRGPLGEAVLTLGRAGMATLALLPGQFWVGAGLVFLMNKIMLLKLLGIPLMKGR